MGGLIVKIVKVTNNIWFKVITCSLVVLSIYAFAEFRSIKKDVTTQPPAEQVSTPNTYQPKDSKDKEPKRPFKIDIGNGFIDIIESEYDSASKILKVPENSAAWLTTSQKMGEPGAVLIYGHNSNKIFRSVVNNNDFYAVEVLDELNRVRKFKKIRSEELNPENTSILHNLSGRDEDLILITCSLDYFNSKRVAVYFKELE